MNVRHHFLKVRVPASSVPPRRVTHDEVRAGVKSGEFFVEYQPIVHLTTGTIISAEALVRWRHPAHGLLCPDQFIHLAEKSRAIVPLGKYILREACRDLARLHHDYPARSDFAVHVNVSAHQLEDSGFAAEVKRSLRAMPGMHPECLVLEITETEPAADAEIVRQLAHLKSLGVRLALDDFGTAYASLSNLRESAFDMLKIDRSFVSGLAQRPSDYKLTRTVIELGQMFHLEVVAEGIERHEQLLQLKALGCSLGQGYYFSRPVAADAIGDLLAQYPLEANSRARLLVA
jgi:EAL domain-containing protein (putative c-di-GMP-specific phosphodiesterase class I)